MADVDCTRVHTCAHCGTEFSGRKRKYCSDDCAGEAKYQRDMIVRHIRRKLGTIGSAERKSRIDEFLTEYGDWAGYLESQPGREYYTSPLYKRIARFRAARRQGRAPQYRPLNDGERAIWQAYKARRAAWGRYLAICAQIDSGEWGQVRRLNTPSPYALMTDDQARMSTAREWKWRYNNDPKFRAKEKARLFLAKQRRRYQQEVTDDGTVTAEHIDQRKNCLYCGTKLTDKNRTLDHMIPLSKGGQHSAANVVECCKSCNSRKHAKDFGQWLDELEPQDRRRAEREWIRRKGAPPQQSSLFG